MFSLLDAYVGARITVHVGDEKVSGKLINYKHSQKAPWHSPEVLVLEDATGRDLIVRNWDKIEVL